MGGPAYPPSLTSGRVTLPKVERNTWRPQVPRSTTSTHSRPVFLSILVSAPALPTLARGRQPTLERQRLRPSAANCPGSGLAAGPPLSKTRLVICSSYRSSQGTWMGGQAGSESLLTRKRQAVAADGLAASQHTSNLISGPDSNQRRI